MKNKRFVVLPLLLLAVTSCSEGITKKVTITLNLEESVTIEKGKERKLEYSISPSTYPAYTKVTWKSKDENIASINNGTVTGINFGETTITMQSQYDTSKTKDCHVTVGTPISSIDLNASNPLCLYINSSYSFNPTISPVNASEKSLTWSSSDPSVVSVDDNGNIVALKEGQATITASSKTYPSAKADKCLVQVSNTPIDPTAITLNNTTLSLYPEDEETLKVSYFPTNANHNKEITWSSSDEDIVTVDQKGNIKVNAEAESGATCQITATLTNIPSISASCTVNVLSKTHGKYTVFVYLCGSTLESEDDAGLASADITEMLNATGQTDDVNIVIETGGTTKWTAHDISSQYLQRWHIKNNSLILDQSLTYQSMANSSTLENFLTWGLENYGAKRNALILWNHGGGMQGVCYDEKTDPTYLSKRLHNLDVKKAVTNAITATKFDKLDWIGYDACLMSVQDIADFNSGYANYMIASQESENGYGWEYTTWVNKLFANPLIETQTLLQSIADSYIEAAHDYATYWQKKGYDINDDGTIAILDLDETKMTTYRQNWESFASALSNIITSKTKWNSFASVINNGLRFGASEDTMGEIVYPFDVYDVATFIKKVKSSYSSLSTYLDAVQTALNDIIIYNKYNTYYTSSTGLPCGLCLFCPTSGYTDDQEFTNGQSPYTNWTTLIKKYGQYS